MIRGTGNLPVSFFSTHGRAAHATENVTTVTVPELIERVARLRPRGATKLIAIDGPGCAGKSTLADRLAKATGARIVRTDDFYLPSDERSPEIEHYDTERLQEDVLKPLVFGDDARYQRYDAPADRLADFVDVTSGGIVIVEGAYAMRTQLRSFYDLRIWIDCDREKRLSRGHARDGESAHQRRLSQRQPREDRYTQIHRPADFADVVIDGSVEMS